MMTQLVSSCAQEHKKQTFGTFEQSSTLSCTVYIGIEEDLTTLEAKPSSNGVHFSAICIFSHCEIKFLLRFILKTTIRTFNLRYAVTLCALVWWAMWSVGDVNLRPLSQRKGNLWHNPPVDIWYVKCIPVCVIPSDEWTRRKFSTPFSAGNSQPHVPLSRWARLQVQATPSKLHRTGCDKRLDAKSHPTRLAYTNE